MPNLLKSKKKYLQIKGRKNKNDALCGGYQFIGVYLYNYAKYYCMEMMHSLFLSAEITDYVQERSS